MSRSTPDPDQLSDATFSRRNRRRLPWPLVLAVLACVAFVVWLARQAPERGLTVVGRGHLVVRPESEGGAWAFLEDGALLWVHPDSVTRLGLATGLCARLAGDLKDGRLLLDEAVCTPGAPLGTAVALRARRMGLRWAYWDPSLSSNARTLDAYAETPEIVASMVAPRLSMPQLVRLYAPVVPAQLKALEQQRRIAPPLVIHVQRDDLLTQRMIKSEVRALFAQPVWHVAGAANAGGWVVRKVHLQDGETPDAVRLLLDPLASPWPGLLASSDIDVARGLLLAPLPATP